MFANLSNLFAWINFDLFTNSYRTIEPLHQIIADFKIVQIKAANDFPAQFDVGDLIFADWDDEFAIRLAVDHDVGSLQYWVAEKAVLMEIFALNIFERFLGGG